VFYSQFLPNLFTYSRHYRHANSVAQLVVNPVYVGAGIYQECFWEALETGAFSWREKSWSFTFLWDELTVNVDATLFV